jgi:hypothetical protein
MEGGDGEEQDEVFWCILHKKCTPCALLCPSSSPLSNMKGTFWKRKERGTTPVEETHLPNWRKHTYDQIFFLSFAPIMHGGFG